MLVAGSVYEACKYYELFQSTFLANHCAIVTSYEPSAQKIKGQDTGEGSTEELKKYEVYNKMLNGKSTEAFEEEVKKRFIKEPGKMKLLIVVDKLLTGFDAPAATYLYIDKNMQDHGLFQAICRVNRLDTEDKEFGYIVDYKDLFKSLERSIEDYTSGALDAYDKEDVQGLLKNRLKQAREQLDDALDTVKSLCEPVFPQDQIHFIRYFCGDPENTADLKETEERRVALYKQTVALIRAYANAANEMIQMGYTPKEATDIKEQVRFYVDLRDTIKKASGDYVDLKKFEPGMRQLIDMYITADPSRKISEFDDMSLIELIVQRGEQAVDSLPSGIRADKAAVAETIENNLRRVIIEESPTNPKYYERMSQLLDELIRLRKQKALEYEAYLKRAVELSKSVSQPATSTSYPSSMTTNAKRALYDNLANDETLAIEVDELIRKTKKDGWRGNVIKERELKYAIRNRLPGTFNLDAIFEIIKNQDEY
jgi:type I restriction enzyme R subunit